MTRILENERLFGVVAGVNGSEVQLTAPHAAEFDWSHVGQRNFRGVVGEFIVIRSVTADLLARVTRVELAIAQARAASWMPDSLAPGAAVARADLVATFALDGRIMPGISDMPRLGDSAYAVTGSQLARGLSGDGAVDGLVDLGCLSQYPEVPVRIPVGALLGRHLGIVGTTGGGKSWTLARVAEQVVSSGGRMIILDASGEYGTFGASATHLRAHQDDHGLPIYALRDLDRTLLFRPSPGVQLPKLLRAIGSLRLAAAYPATFPNGLVRRKGLTNRGQWETYFAANAALMRDERAEFRLENLAAQIAEECYYFSGFKETEDKYGLTNQQELGYCSSLIMRVDALAKSTDCAAYLSPANGSNLIAAIDAWLASGVRGILRVDLSGVPSANYLREITVNAIGSHLMEHAKASYFSSDPLVCAVDEAHRFMGRSLGDEGMLVNLDAFDIIAKEGRKYGLSLVVATQRPGDLPAGVISQLGCLIVHRLVDRSDQDHVASSSSHLDRGIVGLLPALVPGEAFLVGAALPLALPVRIEAPSAHPSSLGPQFQAWTAAS